MLEIAAEYNMSKGADAAATEGDVPLVGRFDGLNIPVSISIDCCRKF
jgi:hypothetical protein